MDILMKDVKDFPGYKITSDGKLYSKMILSYQIKTHLSKIGYAKTAIMHKSGKRKHMFLHRLLAIAFLPNPDNLPDVDHIDFDKENNDISNLEWVTHKENQQRWAIRKFGKLNKKPLKRVPKLTDKQVAFIRKKTCTAAALAKKYNVSTVYIYKIWQNDRKKI